MTLTHSALAPPQLASPYLVTASQHFIQLTLLPPLSSSFLLFPPLSSFGSSRSEPPWPLSSLQEYNPSKFCWFAVMKLPSVHLAGVHRVHLTGVHMAVRAWP